MATTQRFHAQDIGSGARCLQFVDVVMQAELKLALFDENRSSSEPSVELAPSTTSDFRNITLGNRDIMVILTAGAPIEVSDLKIGKESILVIGLMSTIAIQSLARRWEMKFTPTEHEVYSTTFHPGEGT